MSESSSERCRRYRRRILEISRQVEAAHVAPAFSCLEIVDCLYHDILRSQDVFIMSKGHGCLAQYVVLEDVGRLPRLALDAYCRPPEFTHFCSPLSLGAHPDYHPRYGIHASTGSLGHGLGIAAGQALAEKLRGTDVQVYVLLSDGECQEGSTWEAAMVAASLDLNNLTALVDANGWSGMGHTSTGGAPILHTLVSKFSAFGWGAVRADGHEHVDQLAAWLRLGWWSERRDLHPRAVVCRTVKGRGVSFMEDDPIWHYRSPSEEEYKAALEELS